MVGGGRAEVDGMAEGGSKSGMVRGGKAEGGGMRAERAEMAELRAETDGAVRRTPSRVWG